MRRLSDSCNMRPRPTAAVVGMVCLLALNQSGAVMPNERERVVEIELQDITLVGRYFDSGREGSGPALLLLHGWSWPDVDPSLRMIETARAFQHAGYTVLTPSMRGWPPSGGSDDCAGRQVDDALQLLEWLSRQRGVDAGKLFLAGFSQGGQIALLAASRGAPIRALAAFAPVVDPESWGKETDVEGIRGYLMEECGGPQGWPARNVMNRLSELVQPVLLVHGDADQRVPTRQSLLLYEKLQEMQRPAQLELIPGAEHDLDVVLLPQRALRFFQHSLDSHHDNRGAVR